jgi:DNA invertase Pin-like site-specific DNA recombinase
MAMAWSVDRLGRSLQDLVAFLSELHALRVDLFLHQQGLDTTTPAGKAMFQMLGVFAEFERSIVAERVRAGLARARDEGTRLGRPPSRAGVKRRQFITLLGGAAAWPIMARAQQTERMRRIGVLMGYAETDPAAQAQVAALRQELQKLGWDEGAQYPH